jgi:hypothetical protein
LASPCSFLSVLYHGSFFVSALAATPRQPTTLRISGV